MPRSERAVAIPGKLDWIRIVSDDDTIGSGGVFRRTWYCSSWLNAPSIWASCPLNSQPKCSSKYASADPPGTVFSKVNAAGVGCPTSPHRSLKTMRPLPFAKPGVVPASDKLLWCDCRYLRCHPVSGSQHIIGYDSPQMTLLRPENPINSPLVASLRPLKGVPAGVGHLAVSWPVQGGGNGFLMRGLKDHRLLDEEWLWLLVLSS